MKKQILVIWTVVLAILLGVGGIAAQDKMDKDKIKKDMKMDMSDKKMKM